MIENRAGGNTLIGTVAVATSGAATVNAAHRRQTFVLNRASLSDAALFDEGARSDRADGGDPAHAGGVEQGAGVEREGADRAREAEADTLTYGTTGPGTIQRIATEYFAGIAGIKLVHVPYKGANETTTAILSGEIDMTINGMSNILPHIGSGKLKALAISTLKRNPLAPDIPTMQEAGVPGYASQGAFGLFAPAGTPRDIIEKVHADVAEILARPDVTKALEARSFVVESAGPAGFEKFIADETVKWRKVIAEANIKID